MHTVRTMLAKKQTSVMSLVALWLEKNICVK